jgi:hypothetical protein
LALSFTYTSEPGPQLGIPPDPDQDSGVCFLLLRVTPPNGGVRGSVPSLGGKIIPWVDVSALGNVRSPDAFLLLCFLVLEGRM